MEKTNHPINYRPISNKDKALMEREREAAQINAYDYEAHRIQLDQWREYYEYRQSGGYINH
jgi:hypothetical protein